MAPDASLSSKSEAPYAYLAFSFPSLSLFYSSTFFFLEFFFLLRVLRCSSSRLS